MGLDGIYFILTMPSHPYLHLPPRWILLTPILINSNHVERSNDTSLTISASFSGFRSLFLDFSSQLSIQLSTNLSYIVPYHSQPKPKLHTTRYEPENTTKKKPQTQNRRLFPPIVPHLERRRPSMSHLK
jgi:hypothetical protein